MMKKLAALTLSLLLMLLSVSALAIDPAFPGDLPERGVSLAMTQEDVAMGLSLSYSMASDATGAPLPVFEVSYADVEAIEAVAKAYEGKDLTSEENFYAAISEMLQHYYRLFEVALFDSAMFDAAGKEYVEQLGDMAILMGENGGYTYLAIDLTDDIAYSDEATREKIVAAALRSRELLSSAQFTEIIFPASELATMSGMLPAFETTDLAGNPVTSEVFAGKDLTVLNVWGTYCNPCIEEMPDLASWSAEMPDNVQLIGVVCDLASLEDAETLESALAICEATGADCYPSLVANESMMPLLSTVVGVPTTFFVDGEGRLVGQPIVGANVPGCRAFVEEYLAGK